METNSNGQHKEQDQAHRPPRHTWRKILSLLSKYSKPLCNVEEASGHKHDPREWAD